MTRRRSKNRKNSTAANAASLKNGSPIHASLPSGPFYQRPWFLASILFLITAALYSPALGHLFVNYDDQAYIVENDHVRAGIALSTIRWALTATEESNWHPLTWISHALDCEFFGLNPTGHHGTSVAVHALNAAFLFLLLLSATGKRWSSLVVAALFALHPLNVESVAWAAERKNVLSMLFFLLALGAYRWYAREPKIGRYAAVAFLYMFGLLAKPVVITFPFVLLLWDYWPLQRMFRVDRQAEETANASIPTKGFSWLVLEKLPLFALSAASAFMTMAAARTDTEKILYPRHILIETAIVSYIQYLEKAFWPSRLAVFYPHPGSTLRTWHVYAALFALVVITALVFDARSRRYLVVGWLWFVGTLVPMLGLQPVGYKGMQGIADRYAYLPFIGLFIMVCWGVADVVAKRESAARSAWLAGLSLAVLLVLAGIARRQIGYWSDNVTLWSHTLQVAAPNWLAENNLGKILMSQGQEEAGVSHFFRAAAIYPNDPVSNMNIALYEQKHGNLSDAVTHFKIAITASHDDKLKIAALNNLGQVYTDLGDPARARECFAAASHLSQ